MMKMRCVFHAAAALILAIAGKAVLCAADAEVFLISADEQAIIDLTNAERISANLVILKPDPKLFAVARSHSANMARQREMSHKLDGKRATDRVSAAGYKYLLVEENIAFNQNGPDEVMDSWMQSTPHRKNILTPEITQIGVGIAEDSNGKPYYTQVFGRPEAAGPTMSAGIVIRNDMRAAITISFPGAGKPSTLLPGVTSRMSVSGVGEVPPLRVEAKNEVKDIRIEDGGKYAVRSSQDSFEVLKEVKRERR